MTNGILSLATSAFSGNNNRIVLNVAPFVFANIAKNFGLSAPLNTVPSSDGYPTSVQSSAIVTNSDLQVGYFGDYVWKYSGASSMQLSPACLIRQQQLNGVNTSSVVVSVTGSGANFAGDTGGNTTIQNQTNPRVVFTPGALIQAISQGASNGSGGNFIRLTFKTNFVSSFSGDINHQIVKVQNSVQSGGGNVADTNAIGIWNYNVVDPSNIDLTTNTVTRSVSAWSANFATPGGEVLTTPQNLTIYIFGSANGCTSYSGFSNLVVCTAANETSIATGLINDPLLISQYQFLMNSASAPASQKGYLRFMDDSGVQGSYEADFTNRMPSTYISYNTTNYLSNSHSAGTITNTIDALTCSDPSQSVWSGSSYLDSAVVQGTVSSTNTTANPTLNVGGHGAKPVFDFTSNPNIFRISAPAASAGLNMVFTFSATWLNGGSPYPFTYTTTTTGPFGDDTTSIGVLNANLVTALVADTTLTTGKVFFGNSGQVVALPRTAQAGSLTITYTSGPAICTMTRIDPGNLTSGTATFIYNQILGGWIYKPNGQIVTVPVEAIIELCNLVGAHCWYNWPVYTSSAYITAFTQFMGDATTGLTSGLRFATEVGNEVWNPHAPSPFAFTGYLAPGIGIGPPSGGEAMQWSWTALRTIQYAILSRAAWVSKGRALSDHYILQMNRYSEAFPGQNFEQFGLKGQLLTTSNPIYNSWSGFGGIAVTDYSTSPNRPIDLINATGFAGYWNSDYIRDIASNAGGDGIFGSVSDNAVWLQASLDYVNGNTATAFAAMTSIFTTMRGSASISAGTYNSSTGKVVLTLSAPINAGIAAPLDIVHTYGLTGTGAVSSLIGGWTAVATTSGTTISYNGPSGLGSITITGGMVVDETAGGVNPDQSNNFPALARAFVNWENILETYDNSAGRTTNSVNGVIGNIHYEGAPQWSVGSNLIDGTNSTGNTAALITQMTSLGWNVNAYDALGGTGATAILHVAQQVLNLIQGWKLDINHTGVAANTGSYKTMIKTYYYQALVNASAGKNREVKPAQYGYQANTWGLFPGLYSQGNPYDNYNAIHEWNA